MATKKGRSQAKSSARSTVSGPSGKRPRSSGDDPATRKMLGTGELAGKRPFNRNKAGEHGAAARRPEEGEHYDAPGPEVTGSTLAESNPSPKVGDGEPPLGENMAGGNLDRVRADASGQPLTTNQGVPVADNQNSLKAGLRGPALLEDFILREKITHFDHERIPERIVHARGSGAHGYFECYEPLTKITRASVFAEAGKRTPVFVRFSTVAGERGSTDTARDVRGFAVKFYTDEGNWDLVGNNMPGVLHPGRDEVSRSHPLGETRAASRHAAGGERARHLLGFRLADARVRAHADVGDVGPRHSAQLPHDAGLRRAHLPHGQ